MSENYFRRWTRFGPKTMSNGKVVNHKVVENFEPNEIDILFVQNEARMWPMHALQVGSARKTLAHTRPMYGRLVRPSRCLFAYKGPSDLKVMKSSASIHEKLR